jgi:fimbrial isopeptide formation D2 family protein/LPXTG-motif cell wall-anchored protein
LIDFLGKQLNMHTSISTRVTAAIGALALGILGAVAVTAPASAAPGPNLTPGDTGTITIHKHKQPLTSGAPATGADQGILPDPIAGVVFSVTPVDDVDLFTNEGWDDAAELAAGLAGAADADEYIADNLNLGTAANLAATNAQGVAVSSALPIGLYLVREVSGPANIVAPAAPFLVTVPLPPLEAGDGWNYAIHVYPKNAVADAPVKSLDTTGAYALGSTVTWTITAKIPAFAEGALTSYVITDDLDSRLQYTAPARVFVDGTQVPAGAVTVSATDPVTVTFTDTGLALLSENAGKDITVEIDTVVNGTGTIVNTAVTNVNGRTFTTNPVDTTWVPVKVIKVDTESPDTKLAGAVFAVYLQETGGTALAFPGNAAGEFTTNASGEVVIPGLKADGTQYWLEEVRAPEGYSALTARVPLVVDENDQAIALPVVPGDTAGSVVTVERVIDNPRILAWELPLTGGDGALWFGVGGAALVAVALGAAVLVTRRKNANV